MLIEDVHSSGLSFFWRVVIEIPKPDWFPHCYLFNNYITCRTIMAFTYDQLKDRHRDDVINTFVLVLYYTKQLDSNVVVFLFDNKSQKMSKYGNNISGKLNYRLVCFIRCSYHISTSSVTNYWTCARQHGIYLLNWYKILRARSSREGKFVLFLKYTKL